MAQPRGTCPLCLQLQPLCDSHIVPNAFYAPLFDNKNHRALRLSVDPALRDGRALSGEWEPLLCGSCEQRTNVYDQHAIKAIKRLVWERPPITDGIPRMGWVDYRRFKLYHMSVLWRAAVAKRPYWKAVTLGAAHMERLRLHVLSGDPGHPSEYSCLLSAMRFDNSPATKFVMAPVRLRFEGQRAYLFTYGGVRWLQFVAQEPPPPNARYFVLSQAGALPLLPDELITKGGFIAKFVAEHIRMGRSRPAWLDELL
jgi:hypothetical protein